MLVEAGIVGIGFIVPRVRCFVFFGTIVWDGMSLIQVCREAGYVDGLRSSTKGYQSAPQDWILRNTFPSTL